jgi:site-specific recombinase XerD
MNKLQLHRPLDHFAVLPVLLQMDGELIFRSVGGLPCFYYPDGKFCFQVTAYLQWLCIKKNLSLKNNGGTLRQYAFHLSHLVRFLYVNQMSCIDLTDSIFELFIRGLEVKVNGLRLRGNPKVREIGSRSLDFIFFTCKALGYPNFVSAIGIVQGFKITPEQRRQFREQYHKLEWYHFCFPSGSSDNVRFPIGEADIVSLRAQADKRSRHLRARMRCMLSVLEFSGARRYEVARLRVMDVVRAHQSKDPSPLVRFETMKQDVVTFRFIPIPRTVVSEWIKYIEESRLEIVDKKIGLKFDHGFVFVSLNKGTPLHPDSVTNDIHDLKVMAGLTAPAHAHLFRHRFITEQLKNLIITYGLVNSASVRSVIVSSELLKLRLKEWSGHRSLKSLDVYIKVAFSELNMIEQVVDATTFGTAVLAATKALEELDTDYLEKLMTEQEYYKKMAGIMADAVVPFKLWLKSI